MSFIYYVPYHVLSFFLQNLAKYSQHYKIGELPIFDKNLKFKDVK